MDSGKVTVIGAAGHVGLAMSLVLTHAGYKVNGVDLNTEYNRMIMSGVMPFQENGAPELLAEALDTGRLTMTGGLDDVLSSRYVVIMVGSPTDQHLNPVLDNLYRLIESLASRLLPGHIVILRSTVTPGTTGRVRNKLETLTGLTEGRDFHLVYAPERVVQGRAIEETAVLPQLIGAFDENSYHLTSSFFRTFSSGENIMLTPVEAELGKLITNMARYVSFALANEFYLIGNLYDANINRIIDACNYDYPRLNLPTPGPNVGGPCLYKDGWFLVERIPFQELISTSFHINESMPMQIVQQLEKFDGICRVAILGMTFKADSDDIRNSLSFKLLHQLERLGYECVTVEPHLKNYAPLSDLKGCDAVVLMTPHREFKNLPAITEAVDNENCVYVDIWGFWDEMRHSSANGIFRSGPREGEPGCVF